MDMFDFDDDFFGQLNQEDIASLFFQAKPLAQQIMNGSACAGLSEDDKKLMSTSFAIATVLLRAYHEAHRRNEQQML